jgi:coatomer protein complex subunit alpha (xenin)
MANGTGFAGDEGVPHVNGIDAEGDEALDEWAAEDAAAHEEDEDNEDAWEIEGEDEGVMDADVDGLVPGDEELTPGASRGVDEMDLWVRNSPFAADHVAAGSFESAMKVRSMFSKKV